MERGSQADLTWKALLLAAAAVVVVTMPETAEAATNLSGAKTTVLNKLSALFGYARNICIGLAAFSFLAFGVMLISGKFNPKWMWTSLAGVAVFGVAGYVANEFVDSSVQAKMGGARVNVGSGIVLK